MCIEREDWKESWVEMPLRLSKEKMIRIQVYGLAIFVDLNLAMISHGQAGGKGEIR